jgi:hypothetical protein
VTTISFIFGARKILFQARNRCNCCNLRPLGNSIAALFAVN